MTDKNFKKVLITFKVTSDQKRWMNEVMSELDYNSRSDLIRDALADFIATEYYKGEVPKKSAVYELQQNREKEALH